MGETLRAVKENESKTNSEHEKFDGERHGVPGPNARVPPRKHMLRRCTLIWRMWRGDAENWSPRCNISHVYCITPLSAQ